jgi:hypothetical protein
VEIQFERRGQVSVTPEPEQASATRILQECSTSRPLFVVSRLLRIQDAVKYLSEIETLLREKTRPFY